MDRRNILKYFNGIRLTSAAGRRRTLTALLIALLTITPLAPSFAKVFLNRFLPASSSISTFAGIDGWQQIFHSKMLINGGHATLSVYGCDESLESVLATLRRIFKSTEENCFTENANCAWLFSTANNQILRLLAMAAPAPDKSVIFAICQSPAEFSRSTAVPSESLIFQQSLLPDSRLTTTIKNEETGAVLETRTLAGVPSRIAGDICSNMSGNGWKCIYPAGDYRPNQCFLIFQRASALCTVIIGPGLPEGKIFVTFYYKESNEQ